LWRLRLGLLWRLRLRLLCRLIQERLELLHETGVASRRWRRALYLVSEHGSDGLKIGHVRRGRRGRPLHLALALKMSL
jgi:hypothetical protein